jgi:hypothetical protein
VVDEPTSAGAPDLGRCDVAREQLQAGLGAGIDHAFQAGKDRGQQVTQPADAARLIADELAAAADQQPDLGVDLDDRVDRAQIAAVSDLVGDHAGVLGIALCARRRRGGPAQQPPGATHRLQQLAALAGRDPDRVRDLLDRVAGAVERGGGLLGAQTPGKLGGTHPRLLSGVWVWAPGGVSPGAQER